jgi:hypothetical protein
MVRLSLSLEKPALGDGGIFLKQGMCRGEAVWRLNRIAAVSVEETTSC